MAWYRSGTVTVANGSSTVTGAGTDFVSNVSLGEAFRGPDGRTYEIATVVSATELTLAEPYMGGSGAGQTYAIQPTASFTRDLALRAATLLNTFGAVRDGIGQGLIGDGSAAAPGIRFAGDQDTGLRRLGDNTLALVCGGVDRMRVSPDGVNLPAGQLTVVGNVVTSPGADRSIFLGSVTNYQWSVAASGDNFEIRENGDPTKVRLKILYPNGNVLIGRSAVSANSARLTVGNVGDGQYVAATFEALNASGAPQVIVFNGGPEAPVWNGAGSVFFVTKNSSTGRSINAGGTINAAGADYAEYMTKAPGCGTIAKGDVCGVDRDGRLTRTWTEAISFVIKSTDPSYVGGDIWGQSVGPRPEGPGEEPAAPIAPPTAPVSEEQGDVSAWQAIIAAYPAQQAAYQSAHAAWTVAKEAYDAALPEWEAALEAERQKVDRIAFAGQVPVNVSGDFEVGDYLIAAASGAGIKAVAVPADTITFDQYRRRVGKVWAVRDGRAWVDVQHG